MMSGCLPIAACTFSNKEVLMSLRGIAGGKTVVPVHGGSMSGSGWEGVYELLAVGLLMWLRQAWVARDDARLGKEAHTLEKSRRWGREL
jgi:hypothetical protein